jgi:hypothetical protein
MILTTAECQRIRLILLNSIRSGNIDISVEQAINLNVSISNVKYFQTNKTKSKLTDRF